MLFRNEAELLACAEAVFAQFDESNSRSLDRLEFTHAVKAIFGVAPSLADFSSRVSPSARASELFSTKDDAPAVKELRVSKDQFLRYVLDKRFLYGTEDATWALFDALDQEGKGYISVDDLGRAVHRGASLFRDNPEWENDHFVRGLFEKLDRDRTGRILFHDFATSVATNR